MKRIILLAFLLFPALLPARAQDASSCSLRILSFNVRTWTRDRDAGSEVYWRTRMAAMARMIEDIDPDVICFQEMLFPATLYIPKATPPPPSSLSTTI